MYETRPSSPHCLLLQLFIFSTGTKFKINWKFDIKKKKNEIESFWWTNTMYAACVYMKNCWKIKQYECIFKLFGLLICHGKYGFSTCSNTWELESSLWDHDELVIIRSYWKPHKYEIWEMVMNRCSTKNFSNDWIHTGSWISIGLLKSLSETTELFTNNIIDINYHWTVYKQLSLILIIVCLVTLKIGKIII
jgi:hypothetical protein